MELEQLKYPIGKYIHPGDISPETRKDWIKRIGEFPDKLELTLANFTDDQLDTPYRPEGWTVRQLVHHIADSHLNAHCRFRHSLTEENPVIKPYDQDGWAALPDANQLPVGPSLDIIRGIHARWAYLLANMGPLDFRKTFYHPEYKKTYDLEWVAGQYAWHGEHHLAQISQLKKRKGW